MKKNVSRSTLSFILAACITCFTPICHSEELASTQLSQACSNEGKSEPSAFGDFFKDLMEKGTVTINFGSSGSTPQKSSDGFWEAESRNSNGLNQYRREKCGPIVRTVEVLERTGGGGPNSLNKTEITDTIVSCKTKMKYVRKLTLNGLEHSNSAKISLDKFTLERVTIVNGDSDTAWWWKDDYRKACGNSTYPDNQDLIATVDILDGYATGEAYKNKVAETKKRELEEYKRQIIADIDKYRVVIVCSEGYYAQMTRTLGERLLAVQKGIAPYKAFSETLFGVREHCKMGSWAVNDPKLLYNKHLIGVIESGKSWQEYHMTGFDSNRQLNMIMIKNP